MHDLQRSGDRSPCRTSGHAGSYVHARTLGGVSSPDAFAVPGVDWVRLGPGLTRLRRLQAGAVLVLTLALLAVLAWRVPGWRVGSGVLAAGAGGLAAVGWRVLDRSVRAWGYAERADDLVVTRGAVWRRIDLVPYGRMQMVDVSSGPAERAFGLASVRLHTASPSTRAYIPGLAPAEAARLRDRLTRRGQQQAAGL